MYINFEIIWLYTASYFQTSWHQQFNTNCISKDLFAFPFLTKTKKNLLIFQTLFLISSCLGIYITQQIPTLFRMAFVPLVENIHSPRNKNVLRANVIFRTEHVFLSPNINNQTQTLYEIPFMHVFLAWCSQEFFNFHIFFLLGFSYIKLHSIEHRTYTKQSKMKF